MRLSKIGIALAGLYAVGGFVVGVETEQLGLPWSILLTYLPFVPEALTGSQLMYLSFALNMVTLYIVGLFIGRMRRGLLKKVLFLAAAALVVYGIYVSSVGEIAFPAVLG